MSCTNKGGREPIYESSFKIAVARDYLISNLGYGKIAKKYNLKNADSAKYMVRWYKKHYPDNAIEPVNTVEAEKDKDTVLPDVNKQLQEANLKITALEMFIAIASKELDVDLQKKFGTKQ